MKKNNIRVNNYAAKINRSIKEKALLKFLFLREHSQTSKTRQPSFCNLFLFLKSL